MLHDRVARQIHDGRVAVERDQQVAALDGATGLGGADPAVAPLGEAVLAAHPRAAAARRARQRQTQPVGLLEQRHRHEFVQCIVIVIVFVFVLLCLRLLLLLLLLDLWVAGI